MILNKQLGLLNDQPIKLNEYGMQVRDGSEPHGSSPYMPESPDLQLEQQGSESPEFQLSNVNEVQPEAQEPKPDAEPEQVIEENKPIQIEKEEEENGNANKNENPEKEQSGGKPEELNNEILVVKKI